MGYYYTIVYFAGCLPLKKIDPVLMNIIIRNPFGQYMIRGAGNRSPMKLMSRALIPRGVLVKVQLVIIFGIPPLGCWSDLGDDGLSFRRKMLGLNFGSHTFRDGFLF
jgi:hypothetical protein